MAEWLANNWFQVLTLLGIVVSWAVHYGISSARWKGVGDKVDEMEKTLDQMDKTFQMHCNNGDIHVSHTLLKLFDERADFIKQQFADMRNDVQRIEGILTADK